jgi:hypothetical protein
VVDGLMSFAEDDWIGLCMISSDVADEFGAEEPDANLELTLVVVRELLKRGLRAGDSPVLGDCVHFNTWPRQEPDVIEDFIRHEWTRRGGRPDWGDCPWFASSRFRRLDA